MQCALIDVILCFKTFRELIVKLCIQAKNWPSQTLLRGKNRRVALKGSLLEHAPKQFGFCVANTKWV